MKKKRVREKFLNSGNTFDILLREEKRRVNTVYDTWKRKYEHLFNVGDCE